MRVGAHLVGGVFKGFRLNSPIRAENDPSKGAFVFEVG